MPTVTKIDAGLIAEKLRSGTPFCFSRFGDGEWTCILQSRPGKGNCDGHKYFPDLGKALGDVLRGKPDYMLGMQNFALRVCSGIDEWLNENGVDLQWFKSDIFHHAAQAGDWSFWDAFKERDGLLVGPAHLSGLGADLVEIPGRNCWQATGDVLPRIRGKGASLIGFCASMAANVWIDRLHAEFPDATLIDIGSVLDPLAGVKSRRYMK